MKRSSFWQYTELSKLRTDELMFFIIMVICNIAVLCNLFLGKIDFSIFIVLVGTTLTLHPLISYHIFRLQTTYPKWYAFSLYASLGCTLCFFITLITKHVIIGVLGLLLLILLTSSISLIMLFFILNIVYYFYLKKRFPFEQASPLQEQRLDFTELSKRMTLESQKAYISLEIFNFSLYAIFTVLLTLFLYKINATLNGPGLAFERWLIESDAINISLLLSVISILIAIYAITVPAQEKIIKEAKAKLKAPIR